MLFQFLLLVIHHLNVELFYKKMILYMQMEKFLVLIVKLIYQ